MRERSGRPLRNTLGSGCAPNTRPENPEQCGAKVVAVLEEMGYVVPLAKAAAG